MEALPPSRTPRGTANPEQSQAFLNYAKSMMRDPSKTHPMFFTNSRVVKAPTGVLVGEGVGRGYVFEEGSSLRKEGSAKL